MSSSAMSEGTACTAHSANFGMGADCNFQFEAGDVLPAAAYGVLFAIHERDGTAWQAACRVSCVVPTVVKRRRHASLRRPIPVEHRVRVVKGPDADLSDRAIR